jgi:indoleamine 2,3-dioxygenase
MSYLQDDPPLPPLAQLFPHLECDPSTLPHSIDPFTVTTTNGFLPVRSPLVELPAVFQPLTDLCNQMPIRKIDGTPGLLAEYKLGSMIDGTALPDLTNDVKELLAQECPDLAVITALFRDYSFLASAYVLEPCWESYNKDPKGGYGLGRAVLPRSIAKPLWLTAEK